MDSRQKMKIVNNLTNDISEKLGRLTNQGVFDFSDLSNVFDFIKFMSDKQYEWMEKNFSKEEIEDFIANNSQ